MFVGSIGSAFKLSGLISVDVFVDEEDDVGLGGGGGVAAGGGCNSLTSKVR